MTSIFKKKAQQLQDAKMALIRAAAIAPAELRPLIDLISKDIWAKNYKMAEVRCKQKADELNQCPKIVDILSEILPGYALFVEIRKKAKGK
jgi:hypothetical protein